VQALLGGADRELSRGPVVAKDVDRVELVPRLEQGVEVLGEDLVAEALLKLLPQRRVRLGGADQLSRLQLDQAIEVGPDVVVGETKHPHPQPTARHHTPPRPSDPVLRLGARPLT
jgi:hypothetical protein